MKKGTINRPCRYCSTQKRNITKRASKLELFYARRTLKATTKKVVTASKQNPTSEKQYREAQNVYNIHGLKRSHT